MHACTWSKSGGDLQLIAMPVMQQQQQQQQQCDVHHKDGTAVFASIGFIPSVLLGCCQLLIQ